MRSLRAVAIVVVVAVLIVVGIIQYRIIVQPPNSPAGMLTIYYAKPDGETLGNWPVTLGPARDPHSVAFYAAVQAVAGPPSSTDAVRFPAGTIVRTVAIDGKTATVDLAGAVTSNGGGTFAESGEFKALVWTLTDVAGISAVRITIDGARVATLPGGHLELDEPLSRSSW
ncbi:MAG: GerMN domain-containing protein [Vulcanimicrobiaceae bacterium]